MQRILTLFLVLTLSLLTSCGFHLRGSVPLAPALHQLYFESKDPYSQLARYLKQALKQSGVNFTENPQNASAVLIILSELQTQQLLSVGGTQQTRVYNLYLTVEYQLTTREGAVILPRQIVSESRNLTIEANQILGGSNEESNLYQQMHRAIVTTIMRRLGSQEVSGAFLHQQETSQKK